MHRYENQRFNRRQFLSASAALAAAPLLGATEAALAQHDPETPRLRFLDDPSICLAPQYLAMELLRQEGFADVAGVSPQPELGLGVVANGQADFVMWDAPGLLPLLDAGQEVLVLCGVHAGCWELFGNGRVQAIRDLKGRRVAVSALGSSEHVYISSMLAYVGMNPKRDIHWLAAGSVPDAMTLFIDGKADAFLAFPPQPQDLRARKIGQVIIDTTQDKPWSQYFCCTLTANANFVRKHPIATKRVVRAMLKAADICTQEPQRAARFMVDRGYEPRYDTALEVIKMVPYRRWRETHPEDTLRFHALRLHDVGMIKTDPNRLIARGTDWRFLNELKRELKA